MNGDDEGGEEEKWLPASVTPLPVQVSSSTITFLIAINGYGQPFTLPYFTCPSLLLLSTCDLEKVISLVKAV